MPNTSYDLLSTVQYGGCSAKIPQDKLTELLNSLPILSDARIMVDISTHDDAGVYRLNDDVALIVTTDFFPPICSAPYAFGEIAAANSLSDVYAMGGTPLLTLNLNMFPAEKIPISVLGEILQGGHTKIAEAGAFVMGGHTIDDYPPKYGLAVVGVVHPDKIITNAGAQIGQKLILTKPLGTGTIIAARRLQMCSETSYEKALTQMKLLNKTGAALMQKYNVKGATDITGFGLLGHALKMAQAANVSFQIEANALPLLDEVEALLDQGCIPGAAFRNLKNTAPYTHYASTLPLARKLAACDAQTSGGLLIAVDNSMAQALLDDLHQSGIHSQAAIIGEVIAHRSKSIYLI